MADGNDTCLLFSIISFLGSCTIIGLLLPTYAVVATLIGGVYLFGCYTHMSPGTIHGMIPSPMNGYCDVSYSYVDYRENVHFNKRVMLCNTAQEEMTVYYNHFKLNKHVITKDMYMKLGVSQGLFISGCIALGLTIGIIITMYHMDKHMRESRRIVPVSRVQDVETPMHLPDIIVIPMKKHVQPEPPIKKYIVS